MSATVISEHVSAPAQRWGFRVRSAPQLEAPFDDDTELPHIEAPPPQTAPGRRPSGGLAPGSSAPAAARYVQVCLEVLNGFRPTSHLRTLTGPVEFDDVLRQLRFRRNAPHRRLDANAARVAPAATTNTSAARGATTHATRGATTNGTRGATIAGTARNTGAARTARVAPGDRGGAPSRGLTERQAGTDRQAFRLRRLRVTEPLPGIAEVVAVLDHGVGALALAMRLEARAGHWLCTLVQVV
jgi:hypothetical protein